MLSTAQKYRSAFQAGLTNPADILAFHRATFGAARMEDDPSGDEPSGDAPADVGPNGFPENKPTAEMTAEQQAAYWKYQSRKHEQRAEARRDYDDIVAERDRLRQANLSDSERAVEDARSEARTQAERDTAAKYQARIVQAEVKAALAGANFPADKIAGQVEFLDHTKFLTGDGEVDTDKVKQYAAGLVPAGGHWPDMGGGNRGNATKAKGVSAGADMFAASRGKST